LNKSPMRRAHHLVPNRHHLCSGEDHARLGLVPIGSRPSPGLPPPEPSQSTAFCFTWRFSRPSSWPRSWSLIPVSCASACVPAASRCRKSTPSAISLPITPKPACGRAATIFPPPHAGSQTLPVITGRCGISASATHGGVSYWSSALLVAALTLGHRAIFSGWDDGQRVRCGASFPAITSKPACRIRTIAAGTGISGGSECAPLREQKTKQEVAVLEIMDRLLNKGLRRKPKRAPIALQLCSQRPAPR
jgi:hypothetical protein